MQSIYYVVSWLCHRTCPHCYEDRFRPYYGERERVAAESRANYARIVSNLPERMVYRDRTGGGVEKPGTIILAGGEVLLEPIREPVLYPALALIRKRYGPELSLIVQTTGDLVTPKIIRELLDLDVTGISVSGMDEYHAGLEKEEARQALREKLTAMFEAAGMHPSTPTEEPPKPRYSFFGATPDMWIGKLWPRGRAWDNGLSQADMTENFCNRWSGGLGFLDYGWEGSEVSIDPQGNVYPCCIKTRLPVGNLLEEPLESILRRRTTDPVYQAISAGQPQRMGLAHGWSEERFIEMSKTTTPDGRPYANLCIGCDRFHQEVLEATPPLIAIGG